MGRDRLDAFPGKHRGFSPGFETLDTLLPEVHPLALVSPASEELSRVKQQASGRAQRSPFPTSICTSQFTSQQAHRQIREHSLHILAPSTPVALIFLALCSHASNSPAILPPWPQPASPEVVLGQRDKSTDTSRAPKPQERNMWWEPDCRVVCLEDFNTQFPSIIRAALGHIVGISRIIEVWEVA